MKNMDTTLDRISAIRWFSRTGLIHELKFNARVRWISSWSDAISIRSSDAMEGSLAAAAGRLTRELSARFRREFRKWNNLVQQAHEMLSEAVFPNADCAIDAAIGSEFAESSELLKVAVRWDIVHFAMEYAYSDLISPAYYSFMLCVYEEGHFPCYCETGINSCDITVI